MKPFKIGTKRYIYDPRAQDDVCLAHILAVMPHPDNDEDQIIVYRFWGKHRKYYFYGAKQASLLGLWNGYVNDVVQYRKKKRKEKKRI